MIEVDGKNGVVYRNGEALDEPYVAAAQYTNGSMDGPVTVKDGHIFVMGDNRQGSCDSRFDSMGQIPEENVYAEALFRFGKIPNFD